MTNAPQDQTVDDEMATELGLDARSVRLEALRLAVAHHGSPADVLTIAHQFTAFVMSGELSRD